MSLALKEPPVAKAKDTTIRIDMDTAELVRRVSALRGVSVGEYVRDTLGPIAQRDLLAEAEKITRAPKKPSR